MLSTPPTKPSFVKYTGTVIRYKNMVLFHAALQDIIKDDYLWTIIDIANRIPNVHVNKSIAPNIIKIKIYLL